MNNLYGKSQYEKTANSLKKELKKQIDKFEDEGAAKVLEQIG
mgnify:FL=1